MEELEELEQDINAVKGGRKTVKLAKDDLKSILHGLATELRTVMEQAEISKGTEDFSQERQTTTERLYTLQARQILKSVRKCPLCGYSEHPEIFELHHIDKNHENNAPLNLILICPNCHRRFHRERSGKKLPLGKEDAGKGS